MAILTYLIPISLFMGGVGLVAFFWAMKTQQFDDPQGNANRILTSKYDDKPAPVDEPAPKG